MAVLRSQISQSARPFSQVLSENTFVKEKEEGALAQQETASLYFLLL